MSEKVEQVIIGVDPHKLSAPIEVVDQRERMLGSIRHGPRRLRRDAVLRQEVAGRGHRTGLLLRSDGVVGPAVTPHRC